MSPVFSCKEASRLASEAHDRRLGLRERWALRIHTAMCSACRAYGRQLALLDDLVRRRGRSSAGGLSQREHLDPAAKERIRQGLRHAVEHPGGGDGTA